MSPLFRRGRPEQAVPVWQPPQPAPPPVVIGDRPCSHPGCANQMGAPCAYEDRRGDLCETAWCPEHQTVIGGKAYCRRHASTVQALGEAQLGSGPVPDIDNRAPSLVNWVTDHLDERVTALLRAHATPGSNEQVTTSAVRLVRPPDGGRRWERGWKLYDHTGAIIKVSVEIEERHDPEVAVRVGRSLSAKGVPPWITHRMRGETLPEAADAAERDAFFDFFFREIEKGVIRERTERKVYKPGQA